MIQNIDVRFVHVEPYLYELEIYEVKGVNVFLTTALMNVF